MQRRCRHLGRHVYLGGNSRGRGAGKLHPWNCHHTSLLSKVAATAAAEVQAPASACLAKPDCRQPQRLARAAGRCTLPAHDTLTIPACFIAASAACKNGSAALEGPGDWGSTSKAPWPQALCMCDGAERRHWVAVAAPWRMLLYLAQLLSDTRSRGSVDCLAAFSSATQPGARHLRPGFGGSIQLRNHLHW